MTDTKNTTDIKNKQSLEHLISLSDMVNELCETTTHPDGRIEHHFPLLNKEDGIAHPDNWNISSKERKMVESNLAVLADYAKEMCKCRQSGTCGYDFSNLDSEILPPWIVFPHYSRHTIGWRMGIGESYKEIWGSYLRCLDGNNREKYKTKYPQPDYWRGYDLR